MPAYKPEFTAAAIRDLASIDAWTSERFGPDQARRYLDALEALFLRVLEEPMGWSSKAIVGFGPNVRLISIRLTYPTGRHRVVYRVHSDSIEFMRIIHDSALLR